MFDDDSTWDGLSGLGTFSILGAWGLSAWLCFGMGNQQGIDAAAKCAAEAGCIVKTENGWFGMDYKTIEHGAVKSNTTKSSR